jgi:hypothetical protein
MEQKITLWPARDILLNKLVLSQSNVRHIEVGFGRRTGAGHRLVADKLTAEAEKIAAEGWKWIEVNADVPFGHTNCLRELEGKAVDLTPEEEAEIPGA